MKISKIRIVLFLLFVATILSRIASFAPALTLSIQPGFREHGNFEWKELFGNSREACSFSLPAPELQIYEPGTGLPAERYSWPNLLEEAREMTLASFSQYPITFLRREAQAGYLKKSKNVMDLLGNKSANVCFSEMHDIVMENFEELKRKFNDIVQWLNCFQQIDENSSKSGEQKSIAVKVIDHRHEEKRAAYGINVNRDRKRIVIVFRGTINDGTMDWIRNFQFGMSKMKTPSSLRDTSEYLPETMHVHQGYYEYLFDNSHRGVHSEEERYDELMKELIPILKENPGYKIYITGHSLGGALATLAAFKMASSLDIEIPKPITCVSIGSPFVGDASFRDAFRDLEKKGWIRKLRITNNGAMEGDPIPCLWPVSLCGKMYKHVGMNLQLFKGTNKFEISYPPSKESVFNEMLRGTGNFLQAISLDPNKMHTFQEYMKRLGLTSSTLQLQMLDDLYKKHAVDRSNNNSCLSASIDEIRPSFQRGSRYGPLAGKTNLSYSSLCSSKFCEQHFGVRSYSRGTVLRQASKEDCSLR